MKSRYTGKDVVINNVDEFSAFKNDRYEGFRLTWYSNIGSGEMLFSKDVNDDNAKWEVMTETMSSNNDKEFIKLVLNKFIDNLDVIE